jgi:hypothetical protein
VLKKYPSKMKNSEIKVYADRNWEELSGFDRAYWAAEYRRRGFKATQKISLALWRHMKSIRNGWPEEEDRRQDLDHHITLKHLLDRYAEANHR